MTVLGRMIQLDDTRLVYVGKSDLQPNFVYVAFRNHEGDDTKLILSEEAWSAIGELFNNPMSGMPLREFPHKMEWRLVCGDGKEAK